MTSPRSALKLPAHTQGLHDLRETQLEQGQAIAEHGRAVASLDQKMTEGFTMLNTRNGTPSPRC